MDPKNSSDEQLEVILREAQNTHVSGSQWEKAKIELDLRRNRSAFEHQQRVFQQQENVAKLQREMLETLRTRLDKITSLLANIGKKPLRAIIIGGTGAVVIGVLINLASKFFGQLFNLQ